jgi:adenylate kinase family enzyme
MRKVLVIGSGGAGKSTFAKRLGARLKTEVIHLDSIYWRPGWVETPKAEWRETIEELLKREAWVMDGNYSGTLELRLRACDTVIFLDLPRILCLWRVAKRWLLYRNRSRPDMAAECLERFSPQFMRWVWKYPKQSRPKVLERLQANAEGKQIIWLRSRAEVERFLSGVPQAAANGLEDEHG